ncbi:hypothetical protein ACFQH2_16620 [Natronoarchaeum sp. GCM10025703]|uniref:hypothetical protein n=1 Tax=unclassified Natronoarchaeum TaxID=2620183 RepID=UPI00361A2DBD
MNPDAETLMDDVLVVTNKGTQEISFLFSGCGMDGWFTSRFGVYVVDGNEWISVMTCDANFANEFEEKSRGAAVSTDRTSSNRAIRL